MMAIHKHGTKLLTRSWGWLREREPSIIVATLLVAAAVWIFIDLADEVLEDETAAVDAWIYGLFRSSENPLLPRGPLWIRETARDFTALGSMPVLAMHVAAVVGYLWLSRARRTMWLVIGSTTTGTLLVFALKKVFSRPRPEGAGDFYTSATSFPSGHSMMSAVVFLSLAILLTRVETHWRIRAYTIAVGVLATVLVGMTRVYLGMHYPTDVAGGWALGVAWALTWWIVPRYFETRGKPRLISDAEGTEPQPTETTKAEA